MGDDERRVDERGGEPTSFSTDPHASTRVTREVPRPSPPEGAATTSPAGAPISAQALPNTRVLVVDADRERREHVGQLLGERYVVELAGDGRDALDRIRASAPDIVLIDHALTGPDEEGPLAAAIKRLPHARSLPVLALTDAADTAALTVGLDGEADDYLRRPFHPSELRARLRIMLRTAALSRRLVLRDRLTTLGTLTAGIAHEVNNPLAAIFSGLRYVQQQLTAPEPTPEDQREIEQALTDAIEGTTRISKIVRDLGSFTHEQPERHEPVDMREVLAAAAMLAQPETQYRAHVVWDLEPVPLIRGDRSRLVQVFVHLLVNAAHALSRRERRDNRIRLSTRTDASDRIVIAVEDNGHGIAADMVDRVFDPFFTTKGVGQGTGLGLWVSRGIVEQIGGEMRVRSEPRRGTTFEVLLPPDTTARPKGAQPPSHVPLIPRTRVLIIEDDELVAHAIRRSLPYCDVTIALGGRAGLEHLLTDDYAVILCDLMMPDLTGMELHERLEKVRPEQAARIVFITGSAHFPQTQAFLQRVSNRRLFKPFTDAELVRTLQQEVPPPAP